MEDLQFKQALVVRLDLKMGRGKIAVQCSHAGVAAAEEARTGHYPWWKGWINEGQRKVALKVPTFGELAKLEKAARALRLPVYLVRDMGLTQVPPGSPTCLGIGPAPAASLDSLTGDLSLL